MNTFVFSSHFSTRWSPRAWSSVSVTPVNLKCQAVHRQRQIWDDTAQANCAGLSALSSPKPRHSSRARRAALECWVKSVSSCRFGGVDEVWCSPLMFPSLLAWRKKTTPVCVWLPVSRSCFINIFIFRINILNEAIYKHTSHKVWHLN